jgi:flagellar FliL protein
MPPPTRPEANAKEPEAGSQTAAAADSPASATGGFKAWLPLLITILVMPLLAFAMTQFFLLPRLQKALGVTAAARTTDAPAQEGKAKEDPKAERDCVPMNKLLVNVAGTMGARYLLVSLSVVSSDSDFKAKMQAHDPQLRDLAGGVLATKTIADLEKPGIRNMIRSELISTFNNALGGAMVQEIYLTEFAIQ